MKREKLLAGLILALIFSIFLGFADAQTVQELDQRLKRVEDSLGITTVIAPIDTTTSLPIYQGIILNGNYDIYPSPYSPMYKDTDGYYKIFIQKAGQPFAVGSLNGLNNWVYSSAGNMPRGTVMKIGTNTWGAVFHQWYNTLCWIYTAGSTNAYNWSNMYLDRTPHGEDVTFIKEGNLYRIYARMAIPPAIRTIGYMEAYDKLTNFSSIVEILKPDAQDGLDQFYSMSVVKGLRGYLGFLNVFNTGTDLVGVQLVWSPNGEDDWERINNRQEVLVKKEGAKCVYACANVIGDEIWIATISCNFGHEELDRNGRFYYTQLYKWKLTEADKLIP